MSNELKKIRINVTAKDIKEGVPGDGRKCPIARAINRRLGPSCYARVIACISIRAPDDIWCGRSTAYRLRKFMEGFDFHRAGKPFTFVLELPVKFLKKA